jgi:hypothetical protein
MWSHSPTLVQEENFQVKRDNSKEEYFQQEILVILMWDKRKGKPSMNKEFGDLWKGSYKIE